MKEVAKITVTFEDGSVMRVGPDEQEPHYWEWHWQDAIEEERQNEDSLSKRSTMPSGDYFWYGGYSNIYHALSAGLDHFDQGRAA